MGNTPDGPADRPLVLITAGNDDPKQHPDLEPCTDEERIYLRQALNRARLLESRARGMFAEALIAKALEDSDFGPHVMSPWDLCWEGIEIAIRATGDVNSYTAEGKKSPSPGWSFPAAGAWAADGVTHTTFADDARRVRADVVVLAHHTGTVLADGWLFVVIHADAINKAARVPGPNGRLPSIRVTASRAEALWPPVKLSDLPRSINWAHKNRDAFQPL